MGATATVPSVDSLPIPPVSSCVGDGRPIHPRRRNGVTSGCAKRPAADARAVVRSASRAGKGRPDGLPRGRWHRTGHALALNPVDLFVSSEPVVARQEHGDPRFRSRSETVPIVVLSSRGDEAGKVQALDLGADDYVTKPFGMDERLARLRAALRHRLQSHGERPVFRVGDFSVELVRRIVKLGDKEVKLSPRNTSCCACRCS